MTADVSNYLTAMATTGENLVKQLADANQKILDLENKLRHKEEECQIVREMYHDCYNDYHALINAIKIINSIFKKSESSLSK